MSEDSEFLAKCYQNITEFNKMFASSKLDKFEAEEIIGKIKGLNIAISIYKEIYG